MKKQNGTTFDNSLSPPGLTTIKKVPTHCYPVAILSFNGRLFALESWSCLCRIEENWEQDGKGRVLFLQINVTQHLPKMYIVITHVCLSDDCLVQR